MQPRIILRLELTQKTHTVKLATPDEQHISRIADRDGEEDA